MSKFPNNFNCLNNTSAKLKLRDGNSNILNESKIRKKLAKHGHNANLREGLNKNKLNIGIW